MKYGCPNIHSSLLLFSPISPPVQPLEDSHIGVFLLSSFVTGREPDAIIHRLKDEELGGRILVRKIFWSYMLFALTSPRGSFVVTLLYTWIPFLLASAVVVTLG